MIRLVTAGLIAAIALSCVPREPVWTGTTTDSAGITIVTNPTEGIWTDEGPLDAR